MEVPNCGLLSRRSPPMAAGSRISPGGRGHSGPGEPAEWAGPLADVAAGPLHRGRRAANRVAGGACWPVWMADSRRLFFICQREQGTAEMAVYDVSTGQCKKQMLSMNAPCMPAISPDGRQLAVISSTAEGVPSSLHLLEIETGKMLPGLSDSGAGQAPLARLYRQQSPGGDHGRWQGQPRDGVGRHGRTPATAGGSVLPRGRSDFWPRAFRWRGRPVRMERNWRTWTPKRILSLLFTWPARHHRSWPSGRRPAVGWAAASSWRPMRIRWFCSRTCISPKVRSPSSARSSPTALGGWSQRHDFGMRPRARGDLPRHQAADSVGSLILGRTLFEYSIMAIRKIRQFTQPPRLMRR